LRVNIYAEEMTDRVELIEKEVEGNKFTAVRFYLELPATGPDGTQHKAPFMHRPGDDDSSAVTFWGKTDLRPMLRKALALLDPLYASCGHRKADPKTGYECVKCGIWIDSSTAVGKSGPTGGDW
jgi:hypothetical protein